MLNNLLALGARLEADAIPTFEPRLVAPTKTAAVITPACIRLRRFLDELMLAIVCLDKTSVPMQNILNICLILVLVDELPDHLAQFRLSRAALVRALVPNKARSQLRGPHHFTLVPCGQGRCARGHAQGHGSLWASVGSTFLIVVGATPSASVVANAASADSPPARSTMLLVLVCDPHCFALRLRLLCRASLCAPPI